MRVYFTTYDGYYITSNGRGKICCYEGFDLCPDRVKKLIKQDGARQLDCFHDEAIKFGYIK